MNVTPDHSNDPFDALRRPEAPIAPNAAFARRLRQRLTTELRPLLATSDRSSALDTSSTSTTSITSTTTERTARMTVTPYLMVRNAAAALEFYRDALGAVELQRLVGDDGRIGHAEIMIGSSKLMMADEYPEIGALGPESRGGPTCSFDIDVVDPALVDQSYERALALGATNQRPPADQFHGSRSATVTDPFGHNWTFSALIEQLTSEEYAARAAQDSGHGSFSLQTAGADAAEHDHNGQVKHHVPGDLYYFSLPVADVAKAQRFFGAVLGWQFAGPEAGHIENITAPPGAVSTTTAGPGPQLWFVVDDIHAAVERVRAAGGTAQEPVDYDSGASADCVDDQGTAFSLSVPIPEYTIR